jgi:hypothetical protein
MPGVTPADSTVTPWGSQIGSGTHLVHMNILAELHLHLFCFSTRSAVNLLLSVNCITTYWPDHPIQYTQTCSRAQPCFVSCL